MHQTVPSFSDQYKYLAHGTLAGFQRLPQKRSHGLNRSRPRVLPARAQLKLDSLPVMHLLLIAAVAIDEMDAPIARCLRLSHIVLLTHELVLGSPTPLPINLSQPVDI